MHVHGSLPGLSWLTCYPFLAGGMHVLLLWSKPWTQTRTDPKENVIAHVNCLLRNLFSTLGEICPSRERAKLPSASWGGRQRCWRDLQTCGSSNTRCNNLNLGQTLENSSIKLLFDIGSNDLKPGMPLHASIAQQTAVLGMHPQLFPNIATSQASAVAVGPTSEMGNTS